MKKRTSLTKQTQFRSALTEAGEKVIEGYFVVFNEFTELFENFFEKIQPSAIVDDIDQQDIRALFDHDSSKVLGRTASNTLALTKDDKGLWGKIIINEDDPEALSIWAKVKRGDVSQASFGFLINDEIYEENDNGIFTTLTDIELLEVSVVAFPAYKTTDINARNSDISQLKKREENFFNSKKSELRRQIILADMKLRKEVTR